MANDIKQKVAGCRVCVACLPSLPAQPVCVDIASYPMEKVAADLFDFRGGSFLVMVDRHSGFPWVTKLRSTSTAAVCAALFDWFVMAGFPRLIKSDGGPQFRGPFREFWAKYNIIHEISSPYHPASNGLAEAAVKSMKRLLEKLDGRVDSDEFKLALLAWRTTPRTDGFAPAFGFYGRHLRTLLPDVRDPIIHTPLKISHRLARPYLRETRRPRVGVPSPLCARETVFWSKTERP